MTFRRLMGIRHKTWLFGLAFFGGLAGVPGVGAAASECGGEVACKIDGGEYYIHMPSGKTAGSSLGAIFYLHGHRGKAVNAIRNKNFQQLADDLGVAFVAVQGVNGTWSFPTAPRNLRDEPAFFDGVLSDLEHRFDVDVDRTLLSGFSSGGFMTWYLACADSKRFSGYAPIAGAFWEPLPQSCPTDAPYLFHVHGTSDTVVPLEGRWLGGGQWKQGDVFESFAIWRQQNNLSEESAIAYQDGKLSCQRWQPETGLLELCLHDGGHSVEAGWMKRAWKTLSGLKGWDNKG
ncbi:polyhydroxybutyrate depolymerase [Roseibium denhamense]|uniref:Polyhydroxybutyrate depolymerase n=1 Tax=Roseibium denhamense TaxID=76305 RepID=A0ABY1PJ94_9HYPH|nr:polyhydroxybutyrate depolymerase [Roseibium denhamense]MTI05873.1 polyhydroxybutyrate depolymerase [Roseibium denhamense]SMP35546.1 polyhydroxybutyrate depolymerase [Roseibium denhamense]